MIVTHPLSKNRSRFHLRKLLRRIPFHLYDKWYYVKCWLWHKHNRVHVRTLSPTWHDRGDLLPHAIFQILEDFVKKECSPGIVDWNADEEHIRLRKRMDELLDWWHNTYLMFDEFEGFDETKEHPERFVPSEKTGFYELQFNEYEHEFYRKAGEKRDAMDRELTEKLCEIIRMRDWLWT